MDNSIKQREVVISFPQVVYTFAGKDFETLEDAEEYKRWAWPRRYFTENRKANRARMEWLIAQAQKHGSMRFTMLNVEGKGYAVDTEGYSRRRYLHDAEDYLALRSSILHEIKHNRYYANQEKQIKDREDTKKRFIASLTPEQKAMFDKLNLHGIPMA